MKEPEWIPRETVLAVQERLLAEFGGAAGVRHEGLLISALSRPLNRFAYEKPTLFELAANYAFGLVRIALSSTATSGSVLSPQCSFQN